MRRTVIDADPPPGLQGPSSIHPSNSKRQSAEDGGGRRMSPHAPSTPRRSNQKYLNDAGSPNASGKGGGRGTPRRLLGTNQRHLHDESKETDHDKHGGRSSGNPMSPPSPPKHVLDLFGSSIVRIDNTEYSSAVLRDIDQISRNLCVNTVVTNLTIGFCKLDDTAGELLGNSLRTNTTLKILNIWDNKISGIGGEGLGKGLAHNSSLQELNIRSNELGSKGALGLSKGLRQSKTIVRLHLRYNWIGDAGAKAIAAALMTNSTITDLDLSRNRIGSEGAEYLMKAVKFNDGLQLLNLQLNTLQDKGGIFVGSALQHNTRLTHLDLMDCMIGDAGCAAIFEALGAATYKSYATVNTARRRQKVASLNNCVKLLHLGGNGIGELGSVQIGKALVHNKGITKLDLTRNRVGNKGASAMAEALKGNTTLTDLMLKDNVIADSGGHELGDAIRANRSIKTLSLSANEMSWKVETDGFVSNSSMSSFENDFNLSKVNVTLNGKRVQGFRMDISQAREKGRVDYPLDIFPALTRKLISLHSEMNNIGAASAHDVANTVGEYLNQNSSLVELNLAKNALKCEHVKCMNFVSLVLLDLSHNSIGNAGAEHIITAFVKVKHGPRITEIDFTDNHISKISPNLAYLTTLDVLYVENNPILGLVPLTATQHGGKAITLWLQKWALQQLHLTEVSKGLGKSVMPAESKAGDDSASKQHVSSPRRLKGCCVDVPGYEPSPCSAILGTEPRFRPTNTDATPGPADYCPWRKEAVNTKDQYKDLWRAVATSSSPPRPAKGDQGPRVLGFAGPRVINAVELTNEQEEAIVEARIQLLEESFNGMTVMPSRWHSATNPKVVEKGRENQYVHKSVLKKEIVPAGWTEQYGVQSILRKLKRERPEWNLTFQHIILALKNRGVLHSDTRLYAERPMLNAYPDPRIPGVAPMRASHFQEQLWHSKTAFSSAVLSVFHGRRLEGFSQLLIFFLLLGVTTIIARMTAADKIVHLTARFPTWLLKLVDKMVHLKALGIARDALAEVDWNKKEEIQMAAVQIRDLFQEVYIRAWKGGAIHDPENFLEDVRKTFEQDALMPDEISDRIAANPHVLAIFAQDTSGNQNHTQRSWMDTGDEFDAGPGSYDPDVYGAIGSDPHKGKTIALPLPPPPNKNPGPADYSPQETQAGRKIGVHYIKAVGITRPVEANGPGPAYDVPGAFDPLLATAPKYSISSKAWTDYRKASEKLDTPGPGAYEHLAPDSTGRAMVMVESAGSSMKATTSGPSWTAGLPLPLLPHMDPTSSARATPGPEYARYTVDRTGAGMTVIEDKVKASSPAFSMRLRTPYSGADAWVGGSKRAESNDVPGPGTYETVPIVGNPKTVENGARPAYSMANDTLGRSAERLTHTSVMGLGMLGIAVVSPQRHQTQEAWQHPAVKACVPEMDMRRASLASNTGALTARDSHGSKSLREWMDVAKSTPPSPLMRGRLVKSPSKKVMEPPFPGPGAYDIGTSIGGLRNTDVLNAPAYTISKDDEERGAALLYHTTDRDWGKSVITPRHAQTARARLHSSHEEAYTTQLQQHERKLARHFHPTTGHKAHRHVRKQREAVREQNVERNARRKEKKIQSPRDSGSLNMSRSLKT